ncbi:MAG: hypothetical protein JRJ29_20490 [Deltaproteobacteria bacterium]|nr:hypothetical protein [Deltaproteobacteria bacterium]
MSVNSQIAGIKEDVISASKILIKRGFCEAFARGRQLLEPSHMQRAWEHYKAEALKKRRT